MTPQKASEGSDKMLRVLANPQSSNPPKIMTLRK